MMRTRDSYAAWLLSGIVICLVVHTKVSIGDDELEIHKNKTKAYCVVYLQREIPKLSTEELTSGFLSVRHGNETHSFMRTNRGLVFANYLPEGFVAEAASRKLRVLDVGTGGGQVVVDLRSHGVDAYGVDIVLNQKQKTQPFFVESSAEHLPYSNYSFDFLISGDSVFDRSYATQLSDSFLSNCLREVDRVLKPGGKAYFKLADKKRIRNLLEKIPGLRIVESDEFKHYVELLKIER